MFSPQYYSIQLDTVKKTTALVGKLQVRRNTVAVLEMNLELLKSSHDLQIENMISPKG